MLPRLSSRTRSRSSRLRGCTSGRRARRSPVTGPSSTRSRAPRGETQPNGDIIQSWQAPGYTVFDLHAAYSLSEILPNAGNVRLFLNVYNVFDKLYIQDAVDNSRFNGFDGDHDADDAEVFFGFPRFINLGFQVSW